MRARLVYVIFGCALLAMYGGGGLAGWWKSVSFGGSGVRGGTGYGGGYGGGFRGGK
jgi:hypothetical protein